MDTSVWLPYVQSYGYVMLFLFLFCGIVGIPAPEESLLFFVGVVVAKEQLLLWPTLASCWGGTMAGMLAAYGAGRWWGAPFVQKYGKYVGITGERWERARDWFRRYGKWGILFGCYAPGVRQICPYMAGVSRFPFRTFVLFATVGTAGWVVPLTLAGLLLGRHIHVPLISFPLAGLALFVLFLLAAWIGQRRRKKSFES
ncbi:alkaline phosphatase [Geobacillus sp. 46C-IIa]|uniref:DedA family protein n=1 Tax=Geobacillus sp. 46C-IIa TaxID=1963025 RepID=UPI0009BFC0E1|nr:DedA family protein [Geobacillus sp. 46C-IIa]OQP04987.1 alkaline phosphatase [Geobacillus sp. 46C-IIa]QNU27701.1 DedA family protein [Geobacillus sp. 46C-IIa]